MCAEENDLFLVIHLIEGVQLALFFAEEPLVLQTCKQLNFSLTFFLRVQEKGLYKRSADGLFKTEGNAMNTTH